MSYMNHSHLWLAAIAAAALLGGCAAQRTCPPEYPLYPAECNYCGDEDPSTPWLGHEPGCPDSLLVDGIPECEAR